MSHARTLGVLLAALFVTGSAAAQAPPKPRKVAFLVGVGTFRQDLPDLKGVPRRDVEALAAVLEPAGFRVVKLTDLDATKKAIEDQFAATLSGGDPSRALGKGDVLLVAICSHGFTFDVPAAGSGVKTSSPFVAGCDALPGKPESMVSLNGLIETARPYGATKLFLIDACREVNDPNRGGTRGIEGTQMTLPKRTAVLFSCGQGQLAHQPDALNQGLFTHVVVKVLSGGTGLKSEVSWADLVAGVGREFRSAGVKKYIPPGREQTPVDAKGETEDVPLIDRAAAGTYALAGENTRIGFVGTKQNGRHEGGFKTLTGTARFPGGRLTGIEVEIDTGSIFTDEPKLTEHLKNPDFFNVKENPTATFKTTKIETTEKGVTVTGDLTLLGKTKPVTFPATVAEKDGTLTLKTEFKIDRTAWGMTYGKGVIGDDVALKIQIAAKK